MKRWHIIAWSMAVGNVIGHWGHDGWDTEHMALDSFLLAAAIYVLTFAAEEFNGYWRNR